ncbi:hypothetical protein [Nocardia sp. NPDC059228]|uniref:hypothetical protein n=1 Tax=Nocardia sp. NPDC059228 TaxID=3346777 RepID=UPI0036C97EDD
MSDLVLNAFHRRQISPPCERRTGKAVPGSPNTKRDKSFRETEPPLVIELADTTVGAGTPLSGGQRMQLAGDRLPDLVMACAECVALIGPPIGRIEPHWAAHQIVWLPIESRPHMNVQEGICVAEDLQIHPPEGRIQSGARPLDRLPQPIHIGEKRSTPRARQLGKALHRRIIGQKQ